MKKLIASILFLTSAAFGQVARQGQVIAASGRPVAGASIWVCIGNVTVTLTANPPCTPAQTIYATYTDAQNSTNAITQPLLTDGNGNYLYYTQSGTVTEAITGNGINGYSAVLTLAPGNAALKPAASDGVRYISSNGSDTQDCRSLGSPCLTLAAAQTSCPASGWCKIDVLENTNLSLTSTFTISRAQTILEGEGYATITTNVPSVDPIDISANDVEIRGLNVLWGSGTTCGIVIPNTVSRVYIHGNYFQNFPSGGCGTAVGIGNKTNTGSATELTDIKVEDNFFLNDAGYDVNGQDFILRAKVANNFIVTAASAANNQIINFQTSDASTTEQDISITGNLMWNALGGDCVQVQQLSGNAIQGLDLEDNKCWLSGITSHGNGSGYSIAGVTGFTRSGNYFDANGVNYAGGNAPFEIINSSFGSASGDVAAMGTQSGSSFSIFTVLGNTGNTVGVNLVGETCSAAFTGTGTTDGFFLGVSTASSSVIRSSVKSSTCDFTGSTGKVAGAEMQANNASATVSNNAFSGLNLIGTNVTGDAGIVVEKDFGTMANNIVGGNQVVNFHLPYSSNLGGQTVGLDPTTVTSPAFASGLSLVSQGGGTITLQAFNTASNLTANVVGDTLTQTLTNKTLTSPTITTPVLNGTPTGTGIATITLKKGSGGGNYTTASTTYAVVDSTNLCYTVTIPTGWKLGVDVSGNLGTSTAVVSASVALTDNAACSTANSGILTEAQTFSNAAGNTEGFGLSWVITGDGNLHNIALQFKTANASDSALMLNSSATLLPTMKFTLIPSN